jgi:hypothetical protein
MKIGFYGLTNFSEPRTTSYEFAIVQESDEPTIAFLLIHQLSYWENHSGCFWYKGTSSALRG